MPTRKELAGAGADFYEVPAPASDPEDEGPVEIEQDEEKQALLKEMLEEAITYQREFVDPPQADATRYYKGEPYGDEEEGRSRVVTREVMEAVQDAMPSLLRLFTGPDKVVEFEPIGPEDEEVAKQQTEYVVHVFMEDNPGFMILHDAMKDALVRKIGVMTWRWEDKTRVEGVDLSGITADDVAALAFDEEIDDLKVSDHPVPMPDGTPLFNVKAKRTIKGGRAVVETIPNEDIVWSPSGRSFDHVPLIAHIRHLPRAELIEMGIPEDIVDASSGKAPISPQTSELAQARPIDEGSQVDTADTQDDSTWPVRYADCYILADWDEDGVVETRRVPLVGEECYIAIEDEDGVPGEIVSGRPFADLCPDPEPHTILGGSLADKVMDIQRIKSQVFRGTLNSLAQALDHQTAVDGDRVNMADVLDTRLGRTIRTQGSPQNAIMDVPHAFVGREALPIIQYLDRMKEVRTVPEAAAGLDPDALQSTTKAGVDATVRGAQEKLEVIARIFAETGIKKLFKGLLRLIVENQDFERTVRIRNKWVKVDPRGWDADKDVRVNVALGSGLVEEKLALLGSIAGSQMGMIQAGIPLATFVELRNTHRRIVELGGWKTADEFFRPWGPEDQAKWDQAQQEAAANQPQDPQAAAAQMLAQIEMLKVQAQNAAAEAKIALERQKMMLEDDRERDKVARESALKELEIELKHKAEINDSMLRAKVARDRAAMDADVKRATAETPQPEEA